MRITATIGIPVYNEEKNIGKLLNYLLKSKFNFKLKEILFVCSGCTDNSVNIIKELMKKNKKIRLFIENERRGKYSAVNKILQNSQSDYIILINGDTMPKGNVINLLIKPFLDPKVGAVTGRPITIQPRNTIVGYLHNLTWDYTHEMSISFRKMTGEICGIKRGLILKLPNKIINDDAYIAAAIPKEYDIKYVPNSETVVIENLTFLNYIKKRRRFAAGAMQLSKLGYNVTLPLLFKLNFIFRRMLKEPDKFFHLIFAVFIEIFCNILAFYDIQKGRIDYKWDS